MMDVEDYRNWLKTLNPDQIKRESRKIRDLSETGHVDLYLLRDRMRLIKAEVDERILEKSKRITQLMIDKVVEMAAQKAERGGSQTIADDIRTLKGKQP